MDATIRDLERAALAGDANAARKLVEERRRGGFAQALAGWVERLRGALHAHVRVSLEAHPTLLADAAYVAERQAKDCAIRLEPGPKYVRVVVGTSAYAFVSRETGDLLKPGGYKGPEPKKIPRGSIYGANPLEGCGPYGVAYVNGGGVGSFAARGLDDAVPIVEVPKALPEPVRKAIPAGRDLRVRQTFGACEVLGEPLEDKGTHFTYRDAHGKVKTVKKDSQPKYAGAAPKRPHVEPCERCSDHPESVFGPGRCGIHGRAEPCQTCQET